MTTTYATAISAAQGGTGKARILFVGDSLTEGEGASARANRWIDQLIPLIRTRYGIAGAGVGLTAWHYATYLSASSGWRTQTNSGAADYTSFLTQGDRGALLKTGNSVTWTVTGDSIDIVYLGSTTGTLNSFTYKIDSATAVTVNTTSPSTYNPGKILHVSLGTSGSHTVKISGTGTTGSLVDGIVVYNGDSTAGVTYWDCSHTAYEAADFTNHSTDYQLGWANFGPSLVVDELIGGNEYLQSDGDNPTQVASKLTARIAVYRALASNPTIVVFIPMRSTGIPANTANSLGYTFEQYVTASKNAAVAAGVNVIDMTALYPSPSAAWFPTSTDPDQIHPNNTGHGIVAGALDTFLETLVPTGATVTAPLATVAATAPAPALTYGSTVSPPAATVATTAPVPTVSAGVTILEPQATVTAASPTPAISAGATILAPTATVTVAAPAPIITASSSVMIIAPAATVGATAPAPTFSIGSTVTAPTAQVTAYAPAPTVSIGAVVTAPTARVTTVAYAPGITVGAVISAPVGTVQAVAWAPAITFGTLRDIVFTAALAPRRWNGTLNARSMAGTLKPRRWNGTLK